MKRARIILGVRNLFDVRLIEVALRAPKRQTRESVQAILDEQRKIVEGADASGEGEPD